MKRLFGKTPAPAAAATPAPTPAPAPAPARTPGARRKTLIVHIGDHKTGSTSIQNAFARQQVRLQGQSVAYPAQVSHNLLRPHFRAYAAEKRPKAREKAIAAFEALAARIRQADADFCLISAEALETVPPPLLHEVVTRYLAPAADEIRVVAYVRPHAARLLSSFAERIKIGLDDALSQPLEGFHAAMAQTGWLAYHPRFSALRGLFGDAFLLRPMIRDQLFRGSVVDDFVRHAFGTEAFRIEGQDQANESLALEDLMRLKLLQTHLAERQPARLRHAMGWEFARVVNTLPPLDARTKLRLHGALARDLHAACLDDARAMDRDFFGGQPLLQAELDAALETAADAPQSTDPADYLPATEIRSLSILSEIIAGMLDNDGRKWPEFLHGKRVAEIRAARADDTGDTGDTG